MNGKCQEVTRVVERPGVATHQDVLWKVRHLQKMARECNALSGAWNEIDQARKVNRKRGAWRRPALAGSVSRLERLLRSEYARLERQIILVLAGASLERARSSEEELEFDESESMDRSRLALVLILLGLWRARQLRAAEDAIGEAFRVGREQVLKRLKRPDAPPQPATESLPAEVLRRYREDAVRFHADLLDGSPRSAGVRTIVETSATVGEAATALRELLDAESWRLTLFSESIIWVSYLSGFRAGAIDGTQAAIAAGVPEDQLIRFEWRGPLDSKTCSRCASQFGPPFVAKSLADIPLPETICEFRRACRHWFGIV